MKKITLILILFLSVINTGFTQTGWVIQPPFTSKNLYSVSPTAVHNLYMGSDSGIVFKSTDNGYNWNIFVQDTALKRLPIRFVFGANNDDFNAVGDSTAYISKVSNQVTSMKIVTGINQTKPNLRAYSFLQGCCQYQPDVVAGDSGIFYIKDDFPWRRDSAATIITPGVRINSSSSYIFVGNNGVIIKADSIGLIRPDGGRIAWRRVPSGTIQNLYGVKVTSSGLCMIVGAAGTILKSTNFGENWTSISSPVQNDLYFIDFTYANLICGASGTILRCTVSSVDNWYRQTTPTTQDLHSILSLDYTDYIAVGNNGIILRTTDGGGPPAGITPVNNEIPNRYELSQNYPNPFNPATNISFSIPKAENVKLEIFDVNGKEVKTLIDENMQAGTYNEYFDASGLASGLYVYKIISGDFTDVKKMVLLK